MARDLDKITEAFRILASVDFPENFLSDAERDFINANAEATKYARAAKMLPERGAEATAEHFGVCVATVYNWVHRHNDRVRFSKLASAA